MINREDIKPGLLFKTPKYNFIGLVIKQSNREDVVIVYWMLCDGKPFVGQAYKNHIEMYGMLNDNARSVPRREY